MTNQDVVELVSLGFSDGVIIDKIRTAQGSDFDTSIPALEELKAAKVSDVVIRAMIGETQWNRSCVSARSSDADRRPSREPNRGPTALEHRTGGPYTLNRCCLIEAPTHLSPTLTCSAMSTRPRPDGYLRRGLGIVDVNVLYHSLLESATPQWLLSPLFRPIGGTDVKRSV
jgi:hypothetical protein